MTAEELLEHRMEAISVTPEMIKAGEEFYPCRDDGDEFNIYFLTRIYQAMRLVAIENEGN